MTCPRTYDSQTADLLQKCGPEGYERSEAVDPSQDISNIGDLRKEPFRFSKGVNLILGFLLDGSADDVVVKVDIISWNTAIEETKDLGASFVMAARGTPVRGLGNDEVDHQHDADHRPFSIDWQEVVERVSIVVEFKCDRGE